MDLAIDVTDSFKKATEKWKKIVPGTMKCSETFSGKIGGVMKSIRDKHQGRNNILDGVYFYCMCNFTSFPTRLMYDIYYFTLIDDEDSELCAFSLLVKLLGKKEKNKDDVLLFAFEKCKVLLLWVDYLECHRVAFGLVQIPSTLIYVLWKLFV